MRYLIETEISKGSSLSSNRWACNLSDPDTDPDRFHILFHVLEFFPKYLSNTSSVFKNSQHKG